MTMRVPSWQTITLNIWGKDDLVKISTDNWQPVGDTYTIPDPAMGKFDYDSLWKLALQSRDPRGKGKYINSWLRLKLDNGEPCLMIYDKEFMRVGKDNIATVQVDTKDVWRSPSVYVSALEKWIPFMIMRHRTGIYRIMHKLKVLEHMKEFVGTKIYAWTMYEKILRQGQVVCKGLRFDLNTGELLNPNTDHEPTRCVEHKDKRKEWRKNITAFKKQLRTRLRLGVVETMLDKIRNADTTRCLNVIETHAKLLGRWDSDEYGSLRYQVDRIRQQQKDNKNTSLQVSMNWNKSIEFIAPHVANNTMPNEIFIPLCITIQSIQENAWRSEPTLDQCITTFFNKLSLPLRRHFGVIEKEATVSPDSNLYYTCRPHRRYDSVELPIDQVYNTYKGEIK